MARDSIICRVCGCRMNTVTHMHKHEVVYHGKKRIIIKRYRKCRHCGLQFATVETYADEENPNLPEDVVPFKAPPPPTGVYCPQPDQKGGIAADSSKPSPDQSFPPKKGRRPRNC